MKTAIYWILALLIAGAAMVYQKQTGPTYSVTGEVTLGDRVIEYELARSHGGDDDHLVEIEVGDGPFFGILEWKRYPTGDDYHRKGMTLKDGVLTGVLPHQPPAGKILYRVTVVGSNDAQLIPDSEGTIIRFKGGVPATVLLPHILLMVLAMILAVRTGLEAFRRDADLKTLTLVTFLVLLLGGGVLGPIVQKYAFGVLWSGIPIGWDLTDNKIVVALLTWLIALLAVFKTPRAGRALVLLAAVVTLVIYAIPHSMAGSELDYAAYDSLGVIDNIPK